MVRARRDRRRWCATPCCGTTPARPGAASELVDRAAAAPRAWAEAVGLVPVASFTVTKLRWLAEHEPERAEPGRARRACPTTGSPGGSSSRATASASWTTDRGDASGTGYWSPITGEYRPDLLRAGLRARAVGAPRVRGTARRRRRDRHRDARRARAPATTWPPRSAWASRPGDVVVSLGTSGAVFGEHHAPGLRHRRRRRGLRRRHRAATCRWCARSTRPGCSTPPPDARHRPRRARRTGPAPPSPGAGGLTLLPYLDGERTPNLPDATGTLGGLTRGNATPENLARAAVEGMLCNLVAGVGSLTRLGVAARRVLLIGGASASAAVRRHRPHAVRRCRWSCRARASTSPSARPARPPGRCLGGDEPPAWPVGTETESDPHPGHEGSEITGRYAGAARGACTGADRRPAAPAALPCAPTGSGYCRAPRALGNTPNRGRGCGQARPWAARLRRLRESTMTASSSTAPVIM